MTEFIASESSFFVLLAVYCILGLFTFPVTSVMVINDRISKRKAITLLIISFLVISFVPFGVAFPLTKRLNFFTGKLGQPSFSIFWCFMVFVPLVIGIVSSWLTILKLRKKRDMHIRYFGTTGIFFIWVRTVFYVFAALVYLTFCSFYYVSGIILQNRAVWGTVFLVSFVAYPYIATKLGNRLTRFVQDLVQE
ncbi:hypothetical protein LACPH_002114 [Lacticaseibacillus parahuelsenbergensis]|uniref:Uncharacterized protein n=1 Tax=Lacticaseibacillus parahuelsenbergensis TaxID=3068305 RepID=A0ABY9L1U7_9LACO|nr:hypothetical protein [Lacticaseibacillus sp. NCIMB 15471]WLV77370.1 hypothetical protein LACPH_002114 [Lacticaseibacillus sp. NCIMB 15471]